MGARRLGQKLGQGRGSQVQVVLARVAHGAQDVAAAVGRDPQQAQVVRKVGPVRQDVLQLVLKLGPDQLYRAERGPHLMRGGGHDPAQVLQPLFARKRQLGGEQRLGRGRKLGRDAAHIGHEEPAPDQQRQPVAEPQRGPRRHGRVRREVKRHPRQRHQRDQRHRQRRQRNRVAQPQRRRADGDRNQHQRRERVRRAAGEKQQDAQLHRIHRQVVARPQRRDGHAARGENRVHGRIKRDQPQHR